MSFLGKLHEISLYGLITTIICFFLRITSFEALLQSSIRVNSFVSLYNSILFWCSILFKPNDESEHEEYEQEQYYNGYDQEDCYDDYDEDEDIGFGLSM